MIRGSRTLLFAPFRGAVHACPALISCILFWGSVGPSAAQPASAAPGLCSETPAPEGATATERRVWSALCATGFADLSAGRPEACEPSTAQDWPAAQRVRADFLSQVLLDAPWRDARRSGTLHLRCARVEGRLDLSHRRIETALRIERSLAQIDLTGAELRRFASFMGSRLAQGLPADGVRTSSDVFLTGAAIEGPARLAGARLGGAFEAADARFAAALDLSQARFGGALILRGAAVGAALSLAGARFDLGGDLSQSVVSGPLSAPRLRSAGPVVATGARLGGAADFTGAALPALVLNSAEVVGGLRLDDARIDDLRFAGMRRGPDAALSLRRAAIGALDAAPTPGEMDLRGLRVSRGGWLDRDARRLIAELEQGFPSGGRFAEERAAYLALAEALRRAGRGGAADSVLYAERRRFLARADLGGVERFFWRLWGASAGFGLRPERLIAWAALLIALGAALGAATPRLARLGAARLFGLSLENALAWPSFSGGWRILYRVGALPAALFGLQRVLGAALLLAALVSILAPGTT